MHPGNIFVNAEDPDDPRYIAVDFGIIGTLSPTDQHYLAENFLAFFPPRLPAGGGTAYRIRLGAGGNPGRRIRIGHSHRIGADFRPPAQGYFLRRVSTGPVPDRPPFQHGSAAAAGAAAKDLLNIEGLGDSSIPNWICGKPPSHFWSVGCVTGSGRVPFINRIKHIPRWIDQTPDLPNLVYGLLRQASGGLTVQLHKQEMEQLRRELRGPTGAIFMRWWAPR
jgi:ubiquinone biosynthesis protein